VIVLLVIFLLLILGAFGLATGVTKEPVCAQCGYPTAGLTGDQCPECGSSLEGAGTRPPGRGRWEWVPSRGLSVLCVTLLFLELSIAVVACLIEVCPRTYRDHLSFTATHTGNPNWSIQVSGTGISQIRVRDLSAQRWPSMARANVHVRLRTPAGETLELEIVDTRRHAKYRTSDGQVATPEGISVQDIRDWAGQIKDARTRESVIEESPSLFMFAVAACSGSTVIPPLIGFESADESGNQVWYPALPISLPVLLVWLGTAITVTTYVKRKRLRPIVLWA
jgi:hypothetical protein